MLGHVEVHYTPTLMSEDDEDEEHPERHGGDHKEIQSHTVLLRNSSAVIVPWEFFSR